MEQFRVYFSVSLSGEVVVEAEDEVDARQAVATEFALRDLLASADSVMIDVHEVEEAE